MRILRDLFLSNRFFYAIGFFIALFAFCFVMPEATLWVAGMLLIFSIYIVIYIINLFRIKNPVSASREMKETLSLGSENNISIHLSNLTGKKWKAEVIDELPRQLQQRNFSIQTTILPSATLTLRYPVRPVLRGAYQFGDIQIFISRPPFLAQRRITIRAGATVAVLPSVIEMKKYELYSLPKIARSDGIRQQRRLGHSYEFEQIKAYVAGDDYRSINWKATGRRDELMVNHYEDERSQPVYVVLDASRNMRMPFNGLSLLDHAVNTSLVITNVALQKQDRAGILIFDNKEVKFIKAERRRQQLRQIMRTLYNAKDNRLDADYERLYAVMRQQVKTRSLIFLFTNFESIYSLERMLPYLRRINLIHLLVVVFFENSEVTDFSYEHAGSVEDIYAKTIARKFTTEKSKIVQQLRQYKIQAILSRPEDLSVNTINKYLELKSRGMI